MRKKTVPAIIGCAAAGAIAAFAALSGGGAVEAPPPASQTSAEDPSPAVLSVHADAGSVAKYGRLTLAVDLKAAYDNPYDFKEVDL